MLLKLANLESVLKLLAKFLESEILRSNLLQLMASEFHKRKIPLTELLHILVEFLPYSGDVLGFHTLDLLNQLGHVIDLQETPITVFNQLMQETMVKSDQIQTSSALNENQEASESPETKLGLTEKTELGSDPAQHLLVNNAELRSHNTVFKIFLLLKYVMDHYEEHVVQRDIKKGMADAVDRIETQGPMSNIVDGLKQKTKSSWLERIMNSTLGKICVSNLHKLDDHGILFATSSILLSYLKVSRKVGELAKDQRFFNRYTVVLLKHFQINIGSYSNSQKLLSCQIIRLLTADDIMGKEAVFKMIPTNIRRSNNMFKLSVLDTWRIEDWLAMFDSLTEYLRKTREKLEVGHTDWAQHHPAPKQLIQITTELIEKYVEDFYTNWEPLDSKTFQALLQDVKLSKESSKTNMDQLLQFNHNIEDFKIDYEVLTKDVIVANYFLDELLDENLTELQLKSDIEDPQTLCDGLFLELLNCNSEQKRNKILKILTLLYGKYALKEINIIPYLLNLLESDSHANSHYFILQLLVASVACKENFTRYKNIFNFYQYKGLERMRTHIIKRYRLDPSFWDFKTQEEFKNYTSLKLPLNVDSVNKREECETIMCLFLISSIHFFMKTPSTELTTKRFFPQRTTTVFLSEPDTINTFATLLLSKSEFIVNATLEFIKKVYSHHYLLLSFFNDPSALYAVLYSATP